MLILLLATSLGHGACGSADDDAAASAAGTGGSVAPMTGGLGGASGTGGVSGGMAGVSGAGSGAAGSNVLPMAGMAAGTQAPEPMDGSTPQDAGSDGGTDASSVDAGGSGDDRCSVAVLDPQSPPVALEVSGDLGTHDPALIEADGVFYLWNTGSRVPGKRSNDLRSWQSGERAFNANPAWIASQVPEADDLWAPDVSYFGGLYHLYYSASSFGSNYSCIGHATRERLDSGSWEDQGSVVCSNHGSNDNWNAIDPNVVVDTEGNAYMMFGSFWDGIKAVELDAQGGRKNDALHDIASRNGGAIEAPFAVRRCGYYYLFVSFDRCCDGANSTYNIRVGRSQQVLGPYVDRVGDALLDGGGTLIVEAAGSFRGPGHNAVIFSGDAAYNVFHAYRADNGAPTLRVAELAWDEDGWPVSGGP